MSVTFNQNGTPINLTEFWEQKTQEESPEPSLKITTYLGRGIELCKSWSPSTLESTINKLKSIQSIRFPVGFAMFCGSIAFGFKYNPWCFLIFPVGYTVKYYGSKIINSIVTEYDRQKPHTSLNKMINHISDLLKKDIQKIEHILFTNGYKENIPVFVFPNEVIIRQNYSDYFQRTKEQMQIRPPIAVSRHHYKDGCNDPYITLRVRAKVKEPAEAPFSITLCPMHPVSDLWWKLAIQGDSDRNIATGNGKFISSNNGSHDPIAVFEEIVSGKHNALELDIKAD